MQARVAELLSGFAPQLHDLFVELFQNADDHKATVFKLCLDVHCCTYKPEAIRKV